MPWAGPTPPAPPYTNTTLHYGTAGYVLTPDPVTGGACSHDISLKYICLFEFADILWVSSQSLRSTEQDAAKQDHGQRMTWRLAGGSNLLTAKASGSSARDPAAGQVSWLVHWKVHSIAL